MHARVYASTLYANTLHTDENLLCEHAGTTGLTYFNQVCHRVSPKFCQTFEIDSYVCTLQITMVTRGKLPPPWRVYVHAVCRLSALRFTFRVGGALFYIM